MFPPGSATICRSDPCAQAATGLVVPAQRSGVRNITSSSTTATVTVTTATTAKATHGHIGGTGSGLNGWFFPFHHAQYAPAPPPAARPTMNATVATDLARSLSIATP